MEIRVNNQNYEMSKTAMAQAYAASKGHMGGTKVAKALLTLTFAPNSAKSKRIKAEITKAVQTLEKKQQSTELEGKSVSSSDNKNFEISKGKVSITKEGLELLSDKWESLKSNSEELGKALKQCKGKPKEQEDGNLRSPEKQKVKNLQGRKHQLVSIMGELEGKIPGETLKKLQQLNKAINEPLGKCQKVFTKKHELETEGIRQLENKISALNHAIEKNSSKSFQLLEDCNKFLQTLQVS